MGIGISTGTAISMGAVTGILDIVAVLLRAHQGIVAGTIIATGIITGLLRYY
jgi:hypothetical protein